MMFKRLVAMFLIITLSVAIDDNFFDKSHVPVAPLPKGDNIKARVKKRKKLVAHMKKTSKSSMIPFFKLFSAALAVPGSTISNAEMKRKISPALMPNTGL